MTGPRLTEADVAAAFSAAKSDDFVMGHQHDWQTIERACNEKPLPGGTPTPTASRPDDGVIAPLTRALNQRLDEKEQQGH
ncbi:hypothetical protein Q3V23_32440 [Streptomyces sp. VNUA116]|uniref:hypothetical protein n=1 Tax=Streptomyces sp. VNUA116 TaxID=3062449 RepID=UPI0026752290|nr:hypothetical protein [Streptomyces sp. VNUA116]WKU48402.1 hypothetical protein Q3V23_32440 [Streptomyces sp. VNUA116]